MNVLYYYIGIECLLFLTKSKIKKQSHHHVIKKKKKKTRSTYEYCTTTYHITMRLTNLQILSIIYYINMPIYISNRIGFVFIRVLSGSSQRHAPCYRMIPIFFSTRISHCYYGAIQNIK